MAGRNLADLAQVYNAPQSLSLADLAGQGRAYMMEPGWRSFRRSENVEDRRGDPPIPQSLGKIYEEFARRKAAGPGSIFNAPTISSPFDNDINNLMYEMRLRKEFEDSLRNVEVGFTGPDAPKAVRRRNLGPSNDPFPPVY